MQPFRTDITNISGIPRDAPPQALSPVSVLASDPDARTLFPGLLAWLEAEDARMPMNVTPAPLDRLDGWSFKGAPRHLAHRTGRFFSIVGCRGVIEGARGECVWSRPMIDQPEVGLLGFLCRFEDGLPHLLMQAKREPGGPGLQLSPTVQATKSNFERQHGGRPVPYLRELLAVEAGGRLILDSLMPEQGAFFLGKRNRNVIRLTPGDAPVREGFRWVALPTLVACAARADILQVDGRSVLGGLTLAAAPDLRAGLMAPGVAASLSANGDAGATRRWLARIGAEHRVRTARVPLGGLVGGVLPMGSGGRVHGVRVRCRGREVDGWDQPLVSPGPPGRIALAVRSARGRLEALARARVEPGHGGAALLGPTFVSYADNPAPDGGPDIGQRAVDARNARTIFDAMRADEGGRFGGFHNHVQIVDVSACAPPAATEEEFRWITLGEHLALVMLGLITIEFRSVMACLPLFADAYRTASTARDPGPKCVELGPAMVPSGHGG